MPDDRDDYFVCPLSMILGMLVDFPDDEVVGRASVFCREVMTVRDVLDLCVDIAPEEKLFVEAHRRELMIQIGQDAARWPCIDESSRLFERLRMIQRQVGNAKDWP